MKDSYLYDGMGEELNVQPHELTEFVSGIPRRVIEHYDVVVDACSDPTFWIQTEDLIRRLGHKTYFPCRQLSGPGMLHDDCLRNNSIEDLEIGAEKARTRNILLVNHRLCQAYPDKRLFKIEGPVEAVQLAHLIELSWALHERCYNVRAFYASPFIDAGIEKVKFDRIFPRC